MKINTLYMLSVITIIFGLFSCTKIRFDDLREQAGGVTLITDWTNRTSGVSIPANYEVKINGQNFECENSINSLPCFAPGTYQTLIYNLPNKISLNGTIANVDTGNSLNVDNNPGWFFTSMLNIVYEDGKNKSVTAIMQQQVRLLIVELAVSEGNSVNIRSISASLTGVANNLDLKTMTYRGTGLSINLPFVYENNKYTSQVRLLGITNEPQKLNVNIIYSNGQNEIIEENVQPLFIGFNSDKVTPFHLKANLTIDNQGMLIGAKIKDWTVNVGGTGDAS